MQKIYIAFSDDFVANKLLNYLNNHFTNIFLLTSFSEVTKAGIVIVDFDFFNENSKQLKDINIILLLDDEKKIEIIQNDFLSISILNMPVKMQDLIFAIEQKQSSIANIYEFRSWYLDLNNNTLYKDDININLSDKEALIIKEFFINNIKNPNQSITKECFLKNVWNISNIEIETQSLESYISILRRKFSDSNVDLVITKNKDGYLLS